MNRWKRAIETWFTGKEEQMVRQIADLVAVPSVGGESAGPCQPFGEGPAKALEVALLQAQAAGLRAENQGGYVLTADLNDCPDELHILAHLDVVAPGEGWDTDPYTLVQEGDLIYGRGVDDDKGPAVAAMMAMECVKALNVPLKRNVKLVLGTDEESGSRDIAHYYATVPYAPCSFSPDAEFPVINIEKGLYTPVITGQWEAQPELPQVVSLTGGIRINVVPRQAEAVIHKLTSCATTPLAVATGWVTGTEIEVVDIEGGVKITCTGRDAHASTPEEGTNAITALLCLRSCPWQTPPRHEPSTPCPRCFPSKITTAAPWALTWPMRSPAASPSAPLSSRWIAPDSAVSLTLGCPSVPPRRTAPMWWKRSASATGSPWREK